MRRTDIPKALEAFGQVTDDKTRYAHEGTGLGLPITAALIRLHGGTLAIGSYGDSLLNVSSTNLKT